MRLRENQTPDPSEVSDYWESDSNSKPWRESRTSLISVHRTYLNKRMVALLGAFKWIFKRTCIMTFWVGVLVMCLNLSSGDCMFATTNQLHPTEHTCQQAVISTLLPQTQKNTTILAFCVPITQTSI